MLDQCLISGNHWLLNSESVVINGESAVSGGSVVTAVNGRELRAHPRGQRSYWIHVLRPCQTTVSTRHCSFATTHRIVPLFFTSMVLDYTNSVLLHCDFYIKYLAIMVFLLWFEKRCSSLASTQAHGRRRLFPGDQPSSSVALPAAKSLHKLVLSFPTSRAASPPIPNWGPCAQPQLPEARF